MEERKGCRMINFSERSRYVCLASSDEPPRPVGSPGCQTTHSVYNTVERSAGCKIDISSSGPRENEFCVCVLSSCVCVAPRPIRPSLKDRSTCLFISWRFFYSPKMFFSLFFASTTLHVAGIPADNQPQTHDGPC